MNCKSLPDT